MYSCSTAGYHFARVGPGLVFVMLIIGAGCGQDAISQSKQAVEQPRLPMSQTGQPEVVLLKPGPDETFEAGAEIEVQAEVRQPANSRWIPRNIIARLMQGRVQHQEVGEEVNFERETYSLPFRAKLKTPNRKGKYTLTVVVSGFDMPADAPASATNARGMPEVATRMIESQVINLILREAR